MLSFEPPKIVGIQPLLLLSQVQNTVPFIFDPEFPKQKSSEPVEFAYLQELKLANTSDPTYLDEIFSNKSRYFKFCLSAHFASVASFVPTDVDNTIRLKLWNFSDRNDSFEMAETVIQSHFWNTNPVSTRWVQSPIHGEYLAGHSGEWFSVAVAAYGAVSKNHPDLGKELQHLIIKKQDEHARVFADFLQTKDGIGALKAATLIAHNLGDMERVIEMWNLKNPEEIRTQDSKSKMFLEKAGNLNRDVMAVENHRHLPLRVPRCLRRSADLLLPLGPFYDDWGKTVARHPFLSAEDIAEVVMALIDGWEKLNRKQKGPMGYARALAGILECFPGGLNAISQYVSGKHSRMLKSGDLRSLCSVPQKRFHDTWNNAGLKYS
jgi:hypothetical protein